MKKVLLSLSILSFNLANANSITLEKAQAISQRAAAYGVSKGWNLSIAVVNSEGNLVYFQRGDGAYAGSIEAAIAKAKSSGSFRRPTSALATAVQTDGRVGLVTVPGIVAIQGGVPIVDGANTIGAIGISGATAVQDEEAANAALVEPETR